MGDYVRTKNCFCIPLRNAEVARNFRSVYGRWSFEVKIPDERCWYIEVDDAEVLTKWLGLLTEREGVELSVLGSGSTHYAGPAPPSPNPNSTMQFESNKWVDEDAEYALNQLVEAAETEIT